MLNNPLHNAHMVLVWLTPPPPLPRRPNLDNLKSVGHGGFFLSALAAAIHSMCLSTRSVWGDDAACLYTGSCLFLQYKSLCVDKVVKQTPTQCGAVLGNAPLHYCWDVVLLDIVMSVTWRQRCTHIRPDK